MTKKILAAALLALAFVAGAATKTVTFNAPTAVTDRGGWQVCLMPDKGPFDAPTTLIARTRVCAYGDDGVTTSCSENTESTAAPPPAYITFLNDRLAAWKAAKGY
jgi:hypothetical protein